MKLMQGSCLERMKEIESKSVDLTVTSPPYDNLRSYNGNNAQWGDDVWKEVIKQLYRVTKPGGVVVWVVGDATIKGSETGTSFKQALWAVVCGFNLHDTMIWDKPHIVPRPSNRYENSMEYMFIFSKGKPESFNPIKDKKNIGYGRKITGHKRNEKGDPVKLHGASNGKTVNEFGTRHNVWRIDTARGRSEYNHPAPFPEQLANDHIISWSNEGDIVLDPFMGSGTTGKMAKLAGRDFIGIELDKDYFRMAQDRISAA
jgi:site-specific DNA-methyltransferase (adenine-specific)